MSLGVRTRTIDMPTYDGSAIRALVTEPDAPGPHPAVTFGHEALGLNAFGRDVATRMAARGYVTITPDYFRGEGPPDPENYADFTDVFTAIQALDFRRAAYDVMAGADWLRDQPNVDSARVAAWGYCTGGTLAMLAACLDRRLGAAVLFFPSQPMFETLTPKRPSHPMDLVWNIACPVLVLYGDQDYLMSAERLAELRRRLEQWGIRHQIQVYEGAKHSFTVQSPELGDPKAAAHAWGVATAFVDRHLMGEEAVA